MSSQRPAIESTLMQIWLQRGLMAWLLWPLSLLFHLVVALRRKLYALGMFKSTRLPVPVIVVGNIFVGGTGKTPCVIWLVEALRQAGYTPGVISRGHGANSQEIQAVNETSAPDKVGDEPLLIFQRTKCPLWIGRNRAAAAQALLNAHPEVDVILSDDGLQHYALQRDIEIVLCDERGDGNGFMLPAGPLREPTSRQRDFTIINSATALPLSNGTASMQLIGDFAEHLPNRSHRVALNALHTLSPTPHTHPLKMAAAAGIGNPQRFFSLLRSAGLKIVEIPLPDHFDYKTNPFLKIDADIILITEKDAVKCAFFDSLPNEQLWVVPVVAQIDAAISEQIVEKLRAIWTT